MRNNKFFASLIAVVAIFSLLLTACDYLPGSDTTPPANDPTTTTDTPDAGASILDTTDSPDTTVTE